MKRTRTVLALITAASLGCHGAVAQHVGDARSPVLAQNLTGLQSSGKVMTALWTLRNDSCTLQLVLPWGMAPADRRTVEQVMVRGASLAAPLPVVKVWLLTANGSHISATKVSRPNSEKVGPRTISAEFSYSFPRSVNGQAVAAAIQIGDEFFIEKLQSFADRPK